MKNPTIGMYVGEEEIERRRRVTPEPAAAHKYDPDEYRVCKVCGAQGDILCKQGQPAAAPVPPTLARLILANRIVDLYERNQVGVGTLIDNHLDRTGNTLGYLRDAALESKVAAAPVPHVTPEQLVYNVAQRDPGFRKHLIEQLTEMGVGVDKGPLREFPVPPEGKPPLQLACQIVRELYGPEPEGNADCWWSMVHRTEKILAAPAQGDEVEEKK